MNPLIETTTVNSDSTLLHCQQRSHSGRRCRMPIFDTASGLCTKHSAARQKDLDQADLAATLIGDNQEFRSAVAINHSLGRTL